MAVTARTATPLAPLTMWTIFSPDPDGRPSHSARLFAVLPAAVVPTGDYMTGRLDVLRAEIARCGYTCIGRDDDTDHPSVLEKWV